MLALLNDQPILVLMATVALGAAVGTIPLGKIRLGASGALFVGLLVGAVLPLSLIHISEPTRRR